MTELNFRSGTYTIFPLKNHLLLAIRWKIYWDENIIDVDYCCMKQKRSEILVYWATKNGNIGLQASQLDTYFSLLRINL